MFGSEARVLRSARIFGGHVIERFNQGTTTRGMRRITEQIPEASTGVCKALCMHWVAHHANDKPGSFSSVALQAGQRGRYGGVNIVLTQLDYVRALVGANATNSERLKDQFTDDFLRKEGLIRQMNIKYPMNNLTVGGNKNSKAGVWLGREIGKKIIANHSANYWSHKIISLYGRAGAHAVAAFVGADAMFFDPNFGIFYFEHAYNFRQWFGEPSGFYWASGYTEILGADYVIKSYAKSI